MPNRTRLKIIEVLARFDDGNTYQLMPQTMALLP